MVAFMSQDLKHMDKEMKLVLPKFSAPWGFELDKDGVEGNGWLIDAGGRSLAYGTKDEFQDLMDLINSHEGRNICPR